jgi:hypothetical protein
VFGFVGIVLVVSLVEMDIVFHLSRLAFQLFFETFKPDGRTRPGNRAVGTVLGRQGWVGVECPW